MAVPGCIECVGLCASELYKALEELVLGLEPRLDGSTLTSNLLQHPHMDDQPQLSGSTAMASPGTTAVASSTSSVRVDVELKPTQASVLLGVGHILEQQPSFPRGRF